MKAPPTPPAIFATSSPVRAVNQNERYDTSFYIIKAICLYNIYNQKAIKLGS